MKSRYLSLIATVFFLFIPIAASAEKVHEYKIAITITGEFSTISEQTAPTIDDLSNRSNEVQLPELGVQLSLIDGNDALLHNSRATDPSTDFADVQLLHDESREFFQSVLNPDDYHFSHVVTLGSNGHASFGNVCGSRTRPHGIIGMYPVEINNKTFIGPEPTEIFSLTAVPVSCFSYCSTFTRQLKQVNMVPKITHPRDTFNAVW